MESMHLESRRGKAVKGGRETASCAEQAQGRTGSGTKSNDTCMKMHANLNNLLEDNEDFLRDNPNNVFQLHGILFDIQGSRIKVRLR